MSERKNTDAAQSHADTSAVKSADITATEKHYSRSLRIRAKVYNFLSENEGQTFEDYSDLVSQASNWHYKGKDDCDIETAKRWITKYTAKNGDFLITEQPNGLTIMRRPTDPR